MPWGYHSMPVERVQRHHRSYEGLMWHFGSPTVKREGYEERGKCASVDRRRRSIAPLATRMDGTGASDLAEAAWRVAPRVARTGAIKGTLQDD